jgi:hypothetical protein
MGCCQSRKGQEEEIPQQLGGAPDQLGLTQSTLSSLESLIEVFQTSNPALLHVPHLEALILFFSKIHLIITKELLERIRLHGNMLQPKNLQALRVLKKNVESFTLEFKGLLLKDSDKTGDEYREFLMKYIDEIQGKIVQFTVDLQDVSQTSLTVFFPDYSEGAQGISTSNFYTGYDRLLSKLKTIDEDLKDKSEGFKSIIAAEFWAHNFKGKDNVEFGEFEKKFSLMTAQMHKVNLNKETLDKIRGELGGSMVGKKEFDEFIWKKWSVGFRRKEFLGK